MTWSKGYNCKISCIQHGQRGIIVKHTENIQQNDPKYSKSEDKNNNFIEIIVFILTRKIL
jgi:hypothetical protein